MSFCNGHHYNFTAPAFDFSRADDRFRFVVAALDDHIRPKRVHEIERCVFVKKHDEVNAFEASNKVGAIALAAHGAGRPLEAFHRCIGIDPDYQRVASRTRRCE